MFKKLPEQQFIPIATEIAGLLISRSSYDEAETIYRTIANATTPDTRNLGMLWLAYCDLQKDENLSARVLLESVPEMDQKNENFPIYCMLQGRLSIVEEKSRAALERLSLSMVLTPTDKFWKAELYYWNAIANKLEGYELASSALLREMTLFFPNDKWTKKLAIDIETIQEPESSP